MSIADYILFITAQRTINGHPHNTQFKDQLELEFVTTSRYMCVCVCVCVCMYVYIYIYIYIHLRFMNSN